MFKSSVLKSTFELTKKSTVDSYLKTDQISDNKDETQKVQNHFNVANLKSNSVYFCSEKFNRLYEYEHVDL